MTEYENELKERLQAELDQARAYNQNFMVLLQHLGGDLYQTPAGFVFEITVSESKKRMVRVIDKEERQEIEKNWPKV